ncbi:MAG: alanine--tRNA ligase [bacterium]|nr:alanine--tRNA ligase [bacterium]
MITSKDLRKKYIEFFKSKGHVEIPSASLVPENDPTVLFTTAGMHPLVPYLLGENHPAGKRLVNVQKCVRTGDIDDVGDSTHNTFFEMLGNWSLGDYFKDESIRWSWEFLTDKKWLGIDPKRIKVTVFEGDKDAPRDDESIKIWQECFEKFKIKAEVYAKEDKNAKTARIFPLPKEDNWWGPAGITGPCGPDTEIFIDLEKPVNLEKCPSGDDCRPGCKCGRYVEIWNNVFMQYNKTAEGKFVPLAQKNVDTGMGMERTLAILNGYSNVYETDVFIPLIGKIGEISGKNYQDYKKEFRIIADHIRASVFMISDGVVPLNVERGYILRRLLRRAIRHGKTLEMPANFLTPLAEAVNNIYKENYSDLKKSKNKMLDEIKNEEEKFEKTLETGLRKLKEYVSKKEKSCTSGIAKILKDNNTDFVSMIPGKDAFDLYQSYGFPPELVKEELAHYQMTYNKEEFDEEFKKHQSLSRTASAGKFKGGLADHSEQTAKYHTATHLLLAALRKVLGENIYQRGSNITAERMRFDFSHSEKMTKEEIKKVEDIVNEQIQKNLLVGLEEMSLEDAKRLGAMGIFEIKYGERVKVYTIGDERTGIFSREICGGPHAANTGVLGKFKIKKEEASSAGVRRIKAILE